MCMLGLHQRLAIICCRSRLFKLFRAVKRRAQHLSTVHMQHMPGSGSAAQQLSALYHDSMPVDSGLESVVESSRRITQHRQEYQEHKRKLQENAEQRNLDLDIAALFTKVLVCSSIHLC